MAGDSTLQADIQRKQPAYRIILTPTKVIFEFYIKMMGMNHFSILDHERLILNTKSGTTIPLQLPWCENDHLQKKKQQQRNVGWLLIPLPHDECYALINNSIA